MKTFETIYNNNKKNKHDNQFLELRKFIEEVYKSLNNNVVEKDIDYLAKNWNWNLHQEVFSKRKTFKQLCREIYASQTETPITK